MNLLLKILISALLIGGISELGRRSIPMAALLAALPLTSIFSIIWIYQETHDVTRIADFSWSVFWYVLPSLAFFALLPWLLNRWHFPVYMAMVVSGLVTVVLFFLLKWVMGRFGIEL